MLAFATEFPVNPSKTARDFLNAVQTWILGSPHTTLLSSDFASMGNSDEWSTPPGPESVSIVSAQTNGEDAAAARYRRSNDDLEWTTIVAFRRFTTVSWTTIHISCESTYPQARLPPPKKPVLVRVLMQHLGTGTDGTLTVQHAPHLLRDDDIDFAAALIDGAAGCRLPVVYVSAGFAGSYTVDPRAIARNLSGMAHVVVEPNRLFSQRLRILVDCNNVYGGTVGVYWPDASGRRAFYIGRDLRSPGEIAEAVCDEVRSALVNRRPLEDCTWSALQTLVSRQRIFQLQASGSKEVQSYVDTFERELQAAREQHERAEKEVSRLSAELRRQQSLGQRNGAPLPMKIGEQDFYEGELLDIIRDSVEDGRNRVPDDSRRQHVLDAFLQANAGTGKAAEHRETLKATLREYRSLDKKTRRALEDLGFTISEEGKHYKLVFQGDDRYTFTLPKTGGDYRGGLNAASDIGKRLF